MRDHFIKWDYIYFNKRHVIAFLVMGLCFYLPGNLYAESKDAVVKQARDALDRTEAFMKTDQGNGTRQEISEKPLDHVPSPTEPGPVTPATEPLDPDILLKEVIDIDLQGEDLSAAFQIISRRTGLPIRVDADVKGTDTLSLQSVQVRDILKVLLDRHDLGLIKEEDGVRIVTAATFENENSYPLDRHLRSRVVSLRHIAPEGLQDALQELKGARGRIILSGDRQTFILVDTAGNLQKMVELIAQKDVEIKTEVFSLTYAPGKEVLEKVKEVLSEGCGYARYDESADEIVVTDTVGSLERIAELIRTWDVPRHVEIETETVRVILSEEYQSGIDWEAIVSDYRCISQEASPCSQEDKDISVGSISREDYDVLIEAMDAVGRMEFKPGPSITAVTRNKIFLRVAFLNNEMFLDLNSPGAGDAAAASDSWRPQNISLPQGMEFRLIPLVHLDQSLTLTVIRPYSRRDKANVKESDEIRLDIGPDTVAVIGGMFKEEKVQMARKVPLLGDLPFLGQFFQRRRTKTRRIEHVVFVRARTLDY